LGLNKILKFFDADPGSGMEKIRIRIRDKHPGSATLMDSHHFGPPDKDPHPSEQPDPNLHQRGPRPTKNITWLGWYRIRIGRAWAGLSDSDPPRNHADLTRKNWQ
jgi:hypothetical protein